MTITHPALIKNHHFEIPSQIQVLQPIICNKNVDAGVCCQQTPTGFCTAKWSGAALLEAGMKKKRGDKYADYIVRTSPFIPWPPKRA